MSLVTFGKRIRELREERGLSLRELARTIGIDPTYLSRVENDALPAGQFPAEATVTKLAEVLGEDNDVLLALAGRVSSEVQAIIRERPQLFAALVKQMRGVPDQVLVDMAREVKDGEW